MHLLNTIAATLAQYRQFHATLRELNGYSDRDLTDMGLGRSDLTRLAWQEAERRFPSPEQSHEAAYPRVAAHRIELAVAGQR